MNKHLEDLKSQASWLRVAALVVGGVGLLLSHEVQKRETRELIEEVISERETARLEMQGKTETN